MKISTKGRYALRLMLDLALNATGEYIPLKTISARQEISEKYLEQIINLLSKAGFVRSTRGAAGGYMLSRDASEYTIGMILRVTEGSLAPVACVDTAYSDCTQHSRCVTFSVWEKLYNAINDVVDNITLSDLVAEQRAMGDDIYMI